MKVSASGAGLTLLAVYTTTTAASLLRGRSLQEPPPYWYPAEISGDRACVYNNAYPASFSTAPSGVQFLHGNEEDCCAAFQLCDAPIPTSRPEKWYPHNDDGAQSCIYANTYPDSYITDPTLAIAFVFNTQDECCASYPSACVSRQSDTNMRWIPNQDSTDCVPFDVPSSMLGTELVSDTREECCEDFTCQEEEEGTITTSTTDVPLTTTTSQKEEFVTNPTGNTTEDTKTATTTNSTTEVSATDPEETLSSFTSSISITSSTSTSSGSHSDGEMRWTPNDDSTDCVYHDMPTSMLGAGFVFDTQAECCEVFTCQEEVEMGMGMGMGTTTTFTIAATIAGITTEEPTATSTATEESTSTITTAEAQTTSTAEETSRPAKWYSHNDDDTLSCIYGSIYPESHITDPAFDTANLFDTQDECCASFPSACVSRQSDSNMRWAPTEDSTDCVYHDIPSSMLGTELVFDSRFDTRWECCEVFTCQEKEEGKTTRSITTDVPETATTEDETTITGTTTTSTLTEEETTTTADETATTELKVEEEVTNPTESTTGDATTKNSTTELSFVTNPEETASSSTISSGSTSSTSTYSTPPPLEEDECYSGVDCKVNEICLSTHHGLILERNSQSSTPGTCVCSGNDACPQDKLCSRRACNGIPIADQGCFTQEELDANCGRSSVCDAALALVNEAGVRACVREEVTTEDSTEESEIYDIYLGLAESYSMSMSMPGTPTRPTRRQTRMPRTTPRPVHEQVTRPTRRPTRTLRPTSTVTEEETTKPAKWTPNEGSNDCVHHGMPTSMLGAGFVFDTRRECCEVFTCQDDKEKTTRSTTTEEETTATVNETTTIDPTTASARTEEDTTTTANETSIADPNEGEKVTNSTEITTEDARTTSSTTTIITTVEETTSTDLLTTSTAADVETTPTADETTTTEPADSTTSNVHNSSSTESNTLFAHTPEASDSTTASTTSEEETTKPTKWTPNEDSNDCVHHDMPTSMLGAGFVFDTRGECCEVFTCQDDEEKEGTTTGSTTTAATAGMTTEEPTTTSTATEDSASTSTTTEIETATTTEETTTIDPTGTSATSKEDTTTIADETTTTEPTDQTTSYVHDPTSKCKWHIDMYKSSTCSNSDDYPTLWTTPENEPDYLFDSAKLCCQSRFPVNCQISDDGCSFDDVAIAVSTALGPEEAENRWLGCKWHLDITAMYTCTNSDNFPSVWEGNAHHMFDSASECCTAKFGKAQCTLANIGCSYATDDGVVVPPPLPPPYYLSKCQWHIDISSRDNVCTNNQVYPEAWDVAPQWHFFPTSEECCQSRFPGAGCGEIVDDCPGPDDREEYDPSYIRITEPRAIFDFEGSSQNINNILAESPDWTLVKDADYAYSGSSSLTNVVTEVWGSTQDLIFKLDLESPSTVNCQAKIRTTEPYDYFTLIVDGHQRNKYTSMLFDWTSVQTGLSSGKHTLQFRVVKADEQPEQYPRDMQSEGTGRVWIDDCEVIRHIR